MSELTGRAAALMHLIAEEAEPQLYTEAELQDAYAKGWADAKAVHGDGLEADWVEALHYGPTRDPWQRGWNAAVNAIARRLRGDNP